ncbi:MAG: glycine cleavage system protein H [Candidatus Limnocylindria bacterium]
MNADQRDTIVARTYRLRLDRRYHRDDHTWALNADGQIRIGLDDLGQATSGDLAQIVLRPIGDRVRQGDELGTLEAQKYVGPLRAPVGGLIVARNEAALRDPRIVNERPYDDGWLVLLRPTAETETDLAGLVGPEDATAWFERKVDAYRRQGVLAQ